MRQGRIAASAGSRRSAPASSGSKRRRGDGSPASEDVQRSAPPPSLSCTAAKNLHTRNCRAISEVASHDFPDSVFRDHAFRDRGPVQPYRGNAGAGGRCPAADRYPPARAHPRRYRARPGGRRRVRPGRAHPADLDPVPPRRGQAGAAGTRNHPRQHVDQRHRADRPRLQLFLASRQHRRGPEQHPPDARSWSRRAAAERAHPDPGPRKDGRLQRRRPAPLLRGGSGQPGADGAPHGSSPQEHDRPRDGNRRRCSTGANACSSRRRKPKPATSSCAAPC